ATLTAHQLHGGAGYVIEHELHRYSARAKEAELRFGSTEEWLEALADELRLARDGPRPREGGPMRFGIHAGPQDCSMADLRRLWLIADERGFHWCSVWAHLY